MNMKHILLVTLLYAFASSAYAAATSKAVAIPDYPADKLSEHVWVIHGPREFPNPKNQGFMNNPALVLTSAGAVIIDPGASVQTGEMVLRVFGKISSAPVVAVFNTHVHGDHWLGNQAIIAKYPDVKIYAHPKMIAEARAGAADSWVSLMHSMTEGATDGTVAVLPNASVNNAEVIKIGNTQFRIYHNGQAHTKTDIMIEALEDSVLFLGDNVTHKRIPRMNDGSFKGNLAVIEIALATKVKHWVPGHGPSGDSTIVTAYRDYLQAVLQSARTAFENDMDSSAVKPLALKATDAYKDWPGYEDELGRQGVQAYMEIEATEF
ncbi:MAG: MBL fold metallo-hydrolase [Gammaproteobacteria bacterium]